MSHKASAWAMEQSTKTPLAKLILLILSDCHNAETGACYPSFQFIAKRAGCSVRSVIYSIESLEKDGLISIQKTHGRPNTYRINQCNDCTSANSAPVQSATEPVQSTTEVVQPLHTTRATIAPKPGSNQEYNQEDNLEYKRTPKTYHKPSTVTSQVWDDFKTLRKSMKAPITETAILGIEREAIKAGISLNEALRVCCERGWRGFKAEWIVEKLVDPKGRFSPATMKSMHNLQEYLRD